MEYAQLNADDTYSHQITTHGNIEWDATHLCPASALTPEEAELFKIAPLVEVPQPVFDSLTHSSIRDGAEFISGQWRYKWTVTALSAEVITERVAAERAALIARTSVVAMKQARLALLQAGLLTAVNAAIATMPEAAQIEWEFSAEVHRGNALVSAMQTLLGWTDAQMDDLFILAFGL